MHYVCNYIALFKQPCQDWYLGQLNDPEILIFSRGTLVLNSQKSSRAYLDSLLDQLNGSGGLHGRCSLFLAATILVRTRSTSLQLTAISVLEQIVQVDPQQVECISSLFALLVDVTSS